VNIKRARLVLALVPGLGAVVIEDGFIWRCGESFPAPVVGPLQCDVPILDGGEEVVVLGTVGAFGLAVVGVWAIELTEINAVLSLAAVIST
jgi:hypothetical protein